MLPALTCHLSITSSVPYSNAAPHGFLRMRCGDCGHDKLVAFSCKRRGLCSWCGARRMAQTSALSVDHVTSHEPQRQWMLSLPIEGLSP